MDPRWRFIILSLLLSPPRVANGCTLDETCVTSGSPFLLFSYSLPWVVLSHVRNLRSMTTLLLRSNPSDVPTASSEGCLACVYRVALCMEGDLSLASFDQSPKAVKSYTAAKHFHRGRHFCVGQLESVFLKRGPIMQS